MDIKLYNWDTWLPPAPLPDTGPKQFRIRQIWAGHNGRSCEVYMISTASIDGDAITVQSLAGNTGLFCPMAISPNARCSVLVADVDCEPTDPDLLYQFLYK